MSTPAGYSDGLGDLKVIWLTLKPLLINLLSFCPQLHAILCYLITCQVGGHNEDGILQHNPTHIEVSQVVHLAINQLNTSLQLVENVEVYMNT